MPGVKRTASRPEPLPDWVQELRKQGREDIDEFVQTTVKVINTGGNAVPFRYMHGQRQIVKAIRRQELQRGYSRIFVLKSRQIGLTTVLASRNFAKMLCTDNLQCKTIAHLDLRAREILEKVKFAYANLPTALQFELSGDSKDEMKFADINSKMTICTANNFDALTGGTTQHQHVSELTRYKDAQGVMEEVENVTHDVPGTSIGIETTARRFGSWSHKFWRLIRSKKTSYEGIFLPWQADPRYDLQFRNDQQRDRALKEVADYDYRLIERGLLFKLTPGNIYWSYLRLKKLKGNWEKFLEDYPCDEEETWRSKGDLWMDDSDKLVALQEVAEEASRDEVVYFLPLDVLENGFRSFQDIAQNVRKDIDPFDDVTPHIIWWQDPRPGRRYVVPGDSASGVVSGDPTSSFCMDMYSGEQMCELHGLMEPHQHAQVMAAICKIYNNAIAAPEVNSMGIATVQELKRIYGNIFVWRMLDDNKGKVSSKLGWYTGEKSRELMLALLKRVLNEVAAGNTMTNGVLRSKRVVHELRTFIFPEGSEKPEAAPGCHDDAIMTMAIGWFVASQEVQGSVDDILNILRPDEARQLIQPVTIDVEDQIARLKSQIRMEEHDDGLDQILQGLYY